MSFSGTERFYGEQILEPSVSLVWEGRFVTDQPDAASDASATQDTGRFLGSCTGWGGGPGTWDLVAAFAPSHGSYKALSGLEVMLTGW